MVSELTYEYTIKNTIQFFVWRLEFLSLDVVVRDTHYIEQNFSSNSAGVSLSSRPTGTIVYSKKQMIIP
jgi:hypothetical protein